MKRSLLCRMAWVLLATCASGRIATAQIPGLAPQETQSDESADEGEARLLPAPQRAVGGIRGVLVTSRLELVNFPEAPLSVSFTHIFPDRTRLRFRELEGIKTGGRRLMRSGARLWEIEPNVPASRILAGDELAGQLLSLEMRRALFLWPQSFDWHFAEDGTSAEVEILHSTKLPQVMGALVAQLGADGRPQRISALLGDGREVAALVPKEWSDAGRPSSLTIEIDGKLVGRETVLKVRTDIYYHDEYFVPPDRRPKRKGKGRRVQRSLDLTEACILRLALPKGASWENARSRRATWAEREAATLADSPHRLDPRASFEIDWQGQPTAVLLRLKIVPNELPKGWSTRQEQPGISLLLGGLEHLDAARMSDLKSSIPRAAKAGQPYLLLVPKSPFGAQVFVSYAPPPK